MAGVPILELNPNTAGGLARVKRADEIDITERGPVAARPVPAQISSALGLPIAGAA